MGPLLELIFFALLSGYIFYRLWSVLGQESEEDKERRERKRRHFEASMEERVVTPSPRPTSGSRVDIEEDNLKSGVREKLRLLQQQDPTFNFSNFIKGAKGAYEMVLDAFAKNDRATLQLLLTAKVYDAFVAEIEEREQRGETYSVTINSFDKIDVDAIEIHGAEVFISVRYRTHQIMVTHNAAGEIIENKARISIPVTEIWTFTRTIGADEPNWYLSRTQTA